VPDFITSFGLVNTALNIIQKVIGIVKPVFEKDKDQEKKDRMELVFL
jgi:hypothetical protein